MLLRPRCVRCHELPGPVCGPCGATLRPALPLPPPHGLESCLAWCRYDDGARDLLVALKNRQRRDVVGWVADAVVTGMAPPSGPAAVLTWAPTTARRRHERGFDQAELLARAVARRWDLPCRALLRRAAGGPQAGLGGAARRAHPGFEPVARVPPHVVVVDDVSTTGATLEAAARALRRAGADRVAAVVVARAASPQGE